MTGAGVAAAQLAAQGVERDLRERTLALVASVGDAHHERVQ
jgi:hypothetical protein